MDSITEGLQLSLQQCQTQFRWERWPCPTADFIKMHSEVAVTRENAWVHSITSAGVTYSISKQCSQGRLTNCSCSHHHHHQQQEDDPRHRSWKWHGCSDSISFGSHTAKQVLDVREAGQDAQALVNLHNNQVGRIGVRRSRVRVCKCHGVSGSCTLQTCWLQLGSFRSVGDTLKKLYRQAIKLKDTNALVAATKTILQPPHEDPSVIPSIDPHRMVFLADSPDFCQANKTAGLAGMVGRQCSRARGQDVPREERRSCRQLCRKCSLGVTKTSTFVTASCNCRFKWCCEVECDTCIREVVNFTCSVKKKRP